MQITRKYEIRSTSGALLATVAVDVAVMAGKEAAFVNELGEAKWWGGKGGYVVPPDRDEWLRDRLYEWGLELATRRGQIDPHPLPTGTMRVKSATAGGQVQIPVDLVMDATIREGCDYLHAGWEAANLGRVNVSQVNYDASGEIESVDLVAATPGNLAAGDWLIPVPKVS